MAPSYRLKWTGRVRRANLGWQPKANLYQPSSHKPGCEITECFLSHPVVSQEIPLGWDGGTGLSVSISPCCCWSSLRLRSTRCTSTLGTSYWPSLKDVWPKNPHTKSWFPSSEAHLLQVQDLPCASAGPCSGSWPRLCPELLGPWSVLSTRGEPPEKYRHSDPKKAHKV